jgi:hypothetical protein
MSRHGRYTLAKGNVTPFQQISAADEQHRQALSFRSTARHHTVKCEVLLPHWVDAGTASPFMENNHWMPDILHRPNMTDLQTKEIILPIVSSQNDILQGAPSIESMDH